MTLHVADPEPESRERSRAEAAISRRPDGTFAPGISGNPGGRSTARAALAAQVGQIMRAPLSEVERERFGFLSLPIDEDTSRLEVIVLSMVDEAVRGDTKAARMLVDRALGPANADEVALSFAEQIRQMQEQIAALAGAVSALLERSR